MPRKKFAQRPQLLGVRLLMGVEDLLVHRHGIGVLSPRLFEFLPVLSVLLIKAVLQLSLVRSIQLVLTVVKSCILDPRRETRASCAIVQQSRNSNQGLVLSWGLVAFRVADGPR